MIFQSLSSCIVTPLFFTSMHIQLYPHSVKAESLQRKLPGVPESNNSPWMELIVKWSRKPEWKRDKTKTNRGWTTGKRLRLGVWVIYQAWDKASARSRGCWDVRNAVVAEVIYATRISHRLLDFLYPSFRSDYSDLYQKRSGTSEILGGPKSNVVSAHVDNWLSFGSSLSTWKGYKRDFEVIVSYLVLNNSVLDIFLQFGVIWPGNLQAHLILCAFLV